MADPRHRKRSKGSTDIRRRRVAIGERPTTARDLNRTATQDAARRRSRRVVTASAAAVAMVAGAVALTYWLTREVTVPPPDAAVPSDAGASSLVVVTGEGDLGASIALVVSHPAFPDRVALFPPNLVAVLPGFGEQTIGEAPLIGGAELSELTVTNLLGTRVDAVSVLTAEQLAALIPAGLEVDLPVPLVVSEGGGEVVDIPAGRTTLDGPTLARLLVTQGSGDQLSWLQRQEAVWKALLASVAGGGALVDGLGTVDRGNPDLGRAALVGVAADPDFALTGLSVGRIGVAGPGSPELYELPAKAVADFLSDQVPFLALREGERPRVEILNGNGDIGTTQPVAALLVRSGFRVVRTDNADGSDYQQSQVIAQGGEHQQDALDIRALLDTGEVLVDQRQPSTVVDVTIIVGKDLPG